ncbi:hypothetical protein [Sphingobacterium sp. CZ-2]|uniref:hypothetical protein n=1 Tax=Sphingobacterium sp. CZ-2 TaxID=2557994 RepID=UPI00106FAEE6|nr:hypothetical protein [Sphingobacterium sp. CZ-2]QBR12813.1 hypothetical protein E3D81_11845 [Sphingobacterium sp. CZ-2]
MRIILLNLAICIGILGICQAQSVEYPEPVVVSYYQAHIKTKKETIKGNFYRATVEEIYLMKDKEMKKIPVSTIKKIKIKFDRKKEAPLFKGMSKTGVDIMKSSLTDEPEKNHNKTDQYGNLLSDADAAPSVGETLLIGTATVATAAMGNELSKLAPQPDIESFKINYSKERYLEQLDEIRIYTIELQTSPEYKSILKDRLKKAMKKKKLAI